MLLQDLTEGGLIHEGKLANLQQLERDILKGKPVRQGRSEGSGPCKSSSLGLF